MPSVYFNVVWPDQSRSQCYSPSTVIKQFLVEGESYDLDVFLEHVRAGLHAASEKVRAKYGYSCSAAADQLKTIEDLVARGNFPSGSTVLVRRITENDL